MLLCTFAKFALAVVIHICAYNLENGNYLHDVKMHLNALKKLVVMEGDY